MHPRIAVLLIAFLVSLPGCATGFVLPDETRQCIVGIAADWDNSHATLQRYRKSKGSWQAEGTPMRARLGKCGLAWGLGIHPVPVAAQLKREGDWRAPAGVFRIGGAWGYAQDIERNPSLPYQRITSRHLWVEDPAHAQYNRNLILPHEPATPWEKKQQMRLNDPAHSLKLFIAHNATPEVKPGMGSSIFFHIWRADGAKPTAGCTTLSELDLRRLIAWIDPGRHPLYILLPADEYASLRQAWRLPPPQGGH